MKSVLSAAGLIAALASGAYADDLTLQSAFAKNLPILGPGADRFAANVSALTDGEINFQHLGAGELSPPLEIFDNVGAGAIDAGWSFAGYQSGKAPAAALFASIPFGGDPLLYISWLNHGGGKEIWREIYEPFGVVPLTCGVVMSEAGGWYTKEINSPKDLKGLNVRIGGLGGDIIASLGANAMSLPLSEVSTSLETGRIDGVEVGFPVIDKLLGFDSVATNYYFPGWHQPAGLTEFYINADKWDSLTDQQRTAIEVSCNDINLWMLGEAAGEQMAVIEEFKAKGINVQRFPDSVLDALRTATDEVLEAKASENADFARVLESYRTYAEAYNGYQALSALK